MHDRAAQDLRPGSTTIVLYPKYRTILEREYMEFRPFGVDEQGKKIRDLTGMSIRATVLYLESFMTRRHGEAVGLQAVQDLCGELVAADRRERPVLLADRRANGVDDQRIRFPARHRLQSRGATPPRP